MGIGSLLARALVQATLPHSDPKAILSTDCRPRRLRIREEGEGRLRKVRVDFDGGLLSSDGGSWPLAKIERRRTILGRLARLFVHHRDPELLEHNAQSLVSERVLDLALGHEDVNDYEQLRADPLLAAVVGIVDPSGRGRR